MRTTTPVRAALARRLLAALILSCAVILTCPAAALAATTSPDGYVYEDELGSAVITGYVGDGGELQIPSTLGALPVTQIADGAFEHAFSVTEATVPEGVTSIGERAFNDCTSMTELTLPSSLQSIGASAFYTCSSLKKVDIPAGVLSIGDYAFFGCLSLEEASIPGSVQSWGVATFAYCGSLRKVSVGEGVAEVPERTFRACTSLEEVELASSVKTLARRSFEKTAVSSCDLSSVVTFGYRSFVPDNYGRMESLDLSSAEVIEEEAFCGQSKLTGVSMPSVVSIGKNAFKEAFDSAAGKTRIELPASLERLDEGALAGCAAGVAAFDVDDACAAYKSVDGCVYTADGSALIAVPAGWGAEEATFEPAAGTARIGALAFSGCQNIQKVTLPDSVSELGEGAFKGTSGLREISLPDGLASIPDEAFSGSGIESVSIPAGVASVGEKAFYQCGGLANATFAGGVRSIGAYAFGSCTSLGSVTLPSSLTSIDPAAFRYASAEVALEDGGELRVVDGSLLSSDGTRLLAVFESAVDQGSQTYTVPDGVATIGEYALADVAPQKIVVPDSVTQIADHGIGYFTDDAGNPKASRESALYGSASNEALVDYAKKNGLALFTSDPQPSCTELKLSVGQTGSFTLGGAVEGVVAYASSDNSVATIAADGTVTAVGGGEADVFANTGLYYCSAHVTVEGAAAEDPYAGYAQLETMDQAHDWGVAETEYNQGASPSSVNTPSAYLYTSENYPAINALLEPNGFKAKADADFGDGEYGEFAVVGQNTAFELSRYKIHEDVLVYSGCEDDEFIPGGGVDLSNVTALIGQDVTFKPVLSTSLVETVAKEFLNGNDARIMLLVYVPKDTTQGALIGEASAASSECEVTFAPGTRFRVVDAGVRYARNYDFDSDTYQGYYPQRFMKLVPVGENGEAPDDHAAATAETGETNPDLFVTVGVVAAVVVAAVVLIVCLRRKRS